jgi:hypothetical protein
MRPTLFRHTCPALIVSLIIVGACTTTPPVPEPAPAAPEYHLDATIKDLMLGAIDTNADVVWNAVMFVDGDKGLIETRPKNDEEWDAARHAALMLMESTNLLKMPGRKVARPHERSIVPGIELEPEEMEKLIEADPAKWNRHAEDLRGAVGLALAAIEAKDSDKLFEVGEKIELACENCHKTYWYPNEVVPEFDFKSIPHEGEPAPK